MLYARLPSNSMKLGLVRTSGPDQNKKSKETTRTPPTAAEPRREKQKREKGGGETKAHPGKKKIEN